MTAYFFIFFLMLRRPPRSTRTDTLFLYTTLFRAMQRPFLLPRQQRLAPADPAPDNEIEDGREEDDERGCGDHAAHHPRSDRDPACRARSGRSEARRVGNECVRTCGSRWTPENSKLISTEPINRSDLSCNQI